MSTETEILNKIKEIENDLNTTNEWYENVSRELAVLMSMVKAKGFVKVSPVMEKK